MQIEQLPDYPALRQLARALWREGTARGAAVLVGAGFSKNCERSAQDTPEPPLWKDFAREMAEQLYSHNPHDIPSDPLRLAEEYRTYFGQAGLDELIRVRICDSAWNPSQIHLDLLGLEWSDVLTTNWDTLLERAAERVHQRHYSRVLSTADLAHTVAPRIVKLHGTIGTTDHFIVAEEDYRTYPTKFAAFVNLARQIFIENELCLLGFSGDDPNFLQWSGWVRDNLGGSSRRIYLVGVLDLSPAKRKFLDARNIAPIDLRPLVASLPTSTQHVNATKLFLEFLLGAKPKPRQNWRPAPAAAYTFLPVTAQEHDKIFKDVNYAASILEKVAEIWNKDRESYPGWLICPVFLRRELLFRTANLRISEDVIDAVDPERREAIVYELFWRYKTSFGRVDEQLAGLLAKFADPAKGRGGLREQRCEIAAFLAGCARRVADSQNFKYWTDIVEEHCASKSDLAAEIAYQKALSARDRFDYQEEMMHATSIVGADPAWAVRRASLLAELGSFDEATKLVVDTIAELTRRQSADRNSLWLRSRRAWVEWLARAIRLNKLSGGEEPRWGSEFRDALSDPEVETDFLRNEAAEALRARREKSNPTIPLFKAGHYQLAGQTVHFQSAATVDPLEALESLIETAGIPIRFDHVSIVGSLARDAVDLAFEPTFRWYVWFLRAVGNPFDALFGRYLGRVAIAQLPLDVTARLSQAVLNAIAYWRDKARDTSAHHRLYAIEALRLFLEVLARLTVRQDVAGARASFDLALDLTKDSTVRHYWLNEPLAHLLEYSIEAMPSADRTPLVLPLLNFPFSDPREGPSSRWPNPIEFLWATRPHRKKGDAEWNHSVSQLLKDAGIECPQRPEAVIRLAYLSRHNVLTEEEAKVFSEVLWSRTSAGGLPADTALRTFMFARLPMPTGVDAGSLICTFLFDRDFAQIIALPDRIGTREIDEKLNLLVDTIAAAQNSLLPSANQAASIFDIVVRWRPASSEAFDPITASLVRPLREGAARLLGEVLRVVVAPSLGADDWTSERLDALLAFLHEVSGSPAAAILPHFLEPTTDRQEKIIGGIQQAVSARTDEEVGGGVMAIEQWAARSICPKLPLQLVDRLISAVESRRSVGMWFVLRGLRRLVLMRLTTENDKSRIVQILGELAIEQQYERIDPDSSEAISVSLVRAECVRLALALKESGTSSPHITSWLTAAPVDPLPEVRFAATEPD